MIAVGIIRNRFAGDNLEAAELWAGVVAAYGSLAVGGVGNGEAGGMGGQTVGSRRLMMAATGWGR